MVTLQSPRKRLRYAYSIHAPQSLARTLREQMVRSHEDGRVRGDRTNVPPHESAVRFSHTHCPLRRSSPNSSEAARCCEENQQQKRLKQNVISHDRMKSQTGEGRGELGDCMKMKKIRIDPPARITVQQAQYSSFGALFQNREITSTSILKYRQQENAGG
jgi:hypothetical protein